MLFYNNLEKRRWCMRTLCFLRECSPCDTDYTDPSLQTTADVRIKGSVFCSNFSVCEKRNLVEEIYCVRKLAIDMAQFILLNRKEFEEAVREEKRVFCENPRIRKFWVFRDGVWQIVRCSTRDVAREVVVFALVMIAREEGERRFFTKDGKLLELNPADAMQNAVRDLRDIHEELRL
ncbi:MAG: hypothetical protein ABIB98_01975 [bacterium]